jgi:hypothetical protein
LELIAEGHRYVDIARRKGVHPSVIGEIASGEIWRQVPGPRPKPRIKNNRYCGVSPTRRGDKWEARIKVNYRDVYLGTFATEIEAAIAYNTHVTNLGLDRKLNEIPEAMEAAE